MKWVLALIAVIIVAGCNGETELVREPKHDLVDVDIYPALMNESITSMELAVKGLMLNDTRNKAIKLFGDPDNFTRFEGEGLVIENLEFGKGWGNNRSGIVVHLENERVTRITVNRGFNYLLHGMTKVGKPNDEIFFSLGSSDSKEILGRFILLQYNDLGIEFITYRGDEIGLSLVSPSETNRNISTEQEIVYIPYADEIVFT